MSRCMDRIPAPPDFRLAIFLRLPGFDPSQKGGGRASADHSGDQGEGGEVRGGEEEHDPGGEDEEELLNDDIVQLKDCHSGNVSKQEAEKAKVEQRLREAMRARE